MADSRKRSRTTEAEEFEPIKKKKASKDVMSISVCDQNRDGVMADSRKRSRAPEPVEVEPSTSKKMKVSKDVGPGLPNLGNTCFFNATLQNLAYTNGLLSQLSKQHTEERKYVIQCTSQVFTVSVGYGDRPLTTAFCGFLQAFNKRNPKMIQFTMKDLYARIEERYERFKDNTQQDSAELLRCLLDGIRKEEIQAIKEEIYKKIDTETDEVVDVEKKLMLKEATRAVLKLKTPIDELFGGELLNTVTCRECLKPEQLVEPFIDISVPIPDEWEDCFEPRKYSDSNKAENPELLQELLSSCCPQMCTKLTMDSFSGKMDGLEKSLAEYTSLDVLDEDNKFICAKCTEDRKKVNSSDYAECLVSKQLLFHSLPQILIVHIKRFHLGQQVTKNNRHIDFPLNLDLAPFCTKKCQRYCVNGRIMYSLYGVVEHSGTLHSGHYMANIRRLVQDGGSKSGDNRSITSSHSEVQGLSSADEHGHWCHASDSHTREATEDEVHSSQAYLLFYEKSSLPSAEPSN